MLFQGGSTHNLLKVITYLFGPYLAKQQIDPITRGVYTYHGPEMKYFDWVLKVNYYVFCKTTKTKRPFWSGSGFGYVLPKSERFLVKSKTIILSNPAVKSVVSKCH